jgi:hypothetical protein
MPSLTLKLPHALSVVTLALLTACGGGGGGGGGTPFFPVGSAPASAPAPEPGPGAGPAPSPAPAYIGGTVAVGAALAGAEVRVLDRNGADSCTVTPLVADDKGAFTCELKSTAAVPLVLVATDPSGLRDAMVSLVTSLPAVGTSGTANISPLTNAIAAQLAPNKDPLALVTDSAALAAIDAGALQAVRANVAQQLADVLTSVGLDPATFDPVSTPFVGGSNTGADKMLDQVRVTFENGSPVLSNVLNPDAAPVPLADAGTAPPAKVAASTAGEFSATELDFLHTGFTACFAVPTATRNGSPACDGLVVDDAPGALTGNATYLSSGQNAETAFGGLIASADMEGARFNRPELLRYTKLQDSRDEAVVNLRFADKNGVPDFRILNVKRFADTSTNGRATNWWLYGNQRTVNAYVRASIRRQEQMLPAAFQEQNNTGPSRFQTGLEIYVARSGYAGSLPNLRYARVKGPGLPDAGLVFADPGNLPQSWMSILNTSGTIPVGPQQFIASSTNLFNLQRSRDITGPDSFALRSNPSIAQAVPAFTNWAHPSMYGQSPSSSWQFDLSKVPSWSRYDFELFTAADSVPATPTDLTPALTFSVRMVTPVVPAAYAATQQWHTIPQSTKALASDGAAAATALTLEWLINPYAQRIESVNAYSFEAFLNVNSASTPVPKGANSRSVVAVGGVFPALTTDHYVTRLLQWRYKVLDGSYKDQTVGFN